MNKTLNLALVGLASAVSSVAFAQTISVAGPFSFVDLLTGPEAGLNTVVPNAATVTTAYQFGSSATINSLNLTSVLGATFASEASVRLVNSAFPALSATLNFTTTTNYTTLSIAPGTVRQYVTNTLNGSNLPSGSTWELTFFETFEDGPGADSTGDTLSMVPAVFVPPPPSVRTPWAVVTGNTVPIIYDNGTIVNAAGQGFGGADASTICTGGTTFGFGSLGPNVRLADDFVVPAGGWTVTAVSAFAYQTGSTIAASPFASSNIEIWNGNPSLPTSAIIATSSTAGNIVWTNAYRTTNVAPFTANNRPVYRVQSTFPSLSLAAGTYWVTYQMNLASGAASFTPYVTGATTQPAAVFSGNAIQQLTVGGAWAAIADATIPVDVPFLVHGTAAAPTNVNLTGTLNLNDTSASFAFARNIAYAVKQGTTTVSSGTLVRNTSTGSFSIAVPASATGAATIEWDGSSFLLRKTAVTLTGSGVAVGNVNVRNGDVDNSGEVDAADIDEVIADFGITTNDPSDVDVSGEVDAADIDIVIANFGNVND